MAVPGSARRATSVRMGSKCCSCPSLEEEQPSEAAVLPCSAAQGEQWQYSAAYPCRHGHCCCPTELRHQGTVLAFPPTVAGGHFCGISFPVCLSGSPSGFEKGWHVSLCSMQAFLMDTQQGLPSLAPALVYRAHCPKCVPSDSSPTFVPYDGSMAVLHPVLH